MNLFHMLLLYYEEIYDAMILKNRSIFIDMYILNGELPFFIIISVYFLYLQIRNFFNY